MNDVEVLTWKKSSASGSSNCVEVAVTQGSVLVRDSKDPQGVWLTFSTPEWAGFLTGLRGGGIDSPY